MFGVSLRCMYSTRAVVASGQQAGSASVVPQDSDRTTLAGVPYIGLQDWAKCHLRSGARCTLPPLAAPSIGGLAAPSIGGLTDRYIVVRVRRTGPDRPTDRAHRSDLPNGQPQWLR